MRILLVEDDRKLSSFVVQGFKEEGFLVDHADNGMDGFHLASTEPYDAAVVDIMLPRLSGLELIADLRKSGILLPVLVLSAKGSVDDRVRGLQTGADDYLTKPFAFTELLARVHALVRRAQAIAEPSSLRAGPIELDLVRRKVTVGGAPVELQPREFSLLEYLMRNKGRVVSKTMIMENVWGYDFDPQTNVVESRVSRLRDKIETNRERPIIRTIRGAGYVVAD